MSRRRFRQLEVDRDRADADRDESAETAAPPSPVFCRNLELDGDRTLDFGTSADRAPQPAACEQPEIVRAPQEPVISPPAAPPLLATHEPGFGTVLASGALAACIFALVSIPVRAAFARGFGESGLWQGASELLSIVALTLVIRRLFAARLRAL